MANSNLITTIAENDFSDNADQWAFGGEALYTNNRIRLTSDSTNVRGYTSLRDTIPDDMWRVDFRLDIENPNNNGSAHETAVNFFADDIYGQAPINGYQLVFDHYDNEIRIDYYQQGVKVNSTVKPYDIPGTGTKRHRIQVSYDQGTFTVLVNSEVAFEYIFRSPDTTHNGFGFSAWTDGEAAAHFIDNVHLLTLTDRNITTAEEEWEESSIDFHKDSNTHSLLRAFFSIVDRQDLNLYDIKHSHHIDTATGGQLDRIGQIINTQRKGGESDAKYRARIKVNFRVGSIGTTFDEFSEFTSVLLDTDIQNIDFQFNFEQRPATVTISMNPQIYDNAALTRSEVTSYLGRAVPAGHNVNALEAGTFRLKSDGETDDPSEGLTSDGSDSGGTLSTDVQ